LQKLFTYLLLLAFLNFMLHPGKTAILLVEGLEESSMMVNSAVELVVGQCVDQSSHTASNHPIHQDDSLPPPFKMLHLADLSYSLSNFIFSIISHCNSTWQFPQPNLISFPSRTVEIPSPPPKKA
jgi:hypothetical protein